MSKAIEFVAIFVHCDTCHHEFETDDPFFWHNKDCPECGSKEIVNDEDIHLYNEQLHINKITNEIFSGIELSGKKTLTIFDTAKIRGIRR